MEPIRVAQIIDVMDSGGIEAVVMNYFRNIDRTRVQFDFITSDTSSLPQKEEIEKLGGRIYLVPKFTHLRRYNKALKEIFIKNKYEIVHCHMGTLAVFPLRVAKKCGIKTRICHMHTTSNKKDWKKNMVKNMLRPFAKKYPTDYFACGELAGKYLFGEKTYNEGKVTIIRNAIDLEKFEYSKDKRDTVRKELNLENKFVIGHVGRFVSVKNHSFLIDVFNEISKNDNDARLLLVGNGPLEDATKEKVEKLNLKDKVVFYGQTNDTSKIYSALDAFVLPSLYEGFPVVSVEAQAAGLPCYFSSNISKECIIANNILTMSIEESPSIWANNILEKKERMDSVNLLIENHCSIKEEASRLLKIYYGFLGDDK